MTHPGDATTPDARAPAGGIAVLRASLCTGRALWWALLLGGGALLLAPLLLVDVPPLLDYPNHLARAFILAQDDRDPVLAAMYGARWSIIPNLALDVVLPPLIRVLPVHVAGRLLIGLALLLPVLGSVLYSRALFGRHSLWALGTGLTTANGMLLLGFLNFQISLGLAPICAAAWAHWRERRPLALAGFAALAAALLFFSHLMGLLLFALLIFCHECAHVARSRQRWSDAGRRLLLLLPAVTVALGLYAASTFGAEATDLDWGSLDQRLIRAMPFVGYDLALDIASTALLAGVLALLLWQRRLRMPPSSLLLLAVLAGLALLAPFGFKGTGYVHARFAVMLAVMLFAATRPVHLPRRTALLVGGVLVGIFVARQAQTAIVWHDHARDLVELRRVTASLPPGSRILTTSVDIDEAAPGHYGLLRRQMLSDGTRIDGHVSALMVIERRAFSPFLFANLSQQPMMLHEPFYAIGQRTVSIPNLAQLAEDTPDQAAGGAFPIAGQWSCCYDYVVLVPSGAHPGFVLPSLDPVARSDYADLFRIRPPSAIAWLP